MVNSIQNRLWQLLTLLADGQFYSGQQLAQQLGLSRATIHNTLNEASKLGIQIQKVHGRGYRLPQAWQPFELDQLQAQLNTAQLPFQLNLHRQIDSTNSQLMRLLSPELASGTVVLAELQTAGRGRLGRTWLSGLGNALTFSLLWRFQCGLNDLAGLSLAVGVAVMRCLHQLAITQAQLKWPNDIVCSQGKLGGILLEAQGDMLGPCAVVIGIGLNCQLPPALSQQIDQRSASLQNLCPHPLKRDELLTQLLRQLDLVLTQFAQNGFAALQNEWQQHHFYQNQAIQLKLPDDSQISAIALGVNEKGGLLLQQNQQQRVVYSGELLTAEG